MGETLPLATIQAAVFAFLQNREDVVVFGAQAVNAWVSEPRMTQDIDLLALNATDLAEEIRQMLSEQFQIAVRVREVKTGLGYRVYQLQKSGNRHLIDIRTVEQLPSFKRIEGVLIIAPADLIAQKVIAFYKRRGKPKAGTDWRDIAMLLLTFPEFKENPSLVANTLQNAQASAEVLAVWQDLAQQDIQPAADDDF
ncbi:MAG: nucleotidyl transferase AbiEii/AbiGii toxin family protein [Leptolyngbyaceae cyanobacterium]